MTRLPESWIMRIFERLKMIYKERWTDHNDNPFRRAKITTLWSSALIGLNAEEIKRALQMCENYPHSPIPTALEFYHFAKGIDYQYKAKPPERNAVNTAIAHNALEKMKHQLSGKLPKQDTVYV